MRNFTEPSITTLKQVPAVIAEQQVQLFKFYLDEAVQEGMSYENELYRLVQPFMGVRS